MIPVKFNTEYMCLLIMISCFILDFIGVFIIILINMITELPVRFDRFKVPSIDEETIYFVSDEWFGI